MSNIVGGDDRRVLLWNTEKATSGIQKPFCMKGEHHSNIFCLAFDHENKKVFSGGIHKMILSICERNFTIISSIVISVNSLVNFSAVQNAFVKVKHQSFLKCSEFLATLY